MKRQKLDELDVIIDHAIEDDVDEFDEFDNLDISDVEFSPSYQRKKRAIIRRYKYAPLVSKVKRLCSRVAMFAGVFLTVALIAVMSVSALREAVIDAVIEWYNDYVSIRFEAETPTENGESELCETEKPWEAVMKARRPREIPEGVEEVVRLSSRTKVAIDYYVDDNFWASYSQNVYNENSIYVDNNAIIIDYIEIKGHDGIIFQYTTKKQIGLIWNDGVYVYRIYTYGTNEELISLAESIE